MQLRMVRYSSSTVKSVRAISLKTTEPVLQGSTNCSILPSRIGEHGVSWETWRTWRTQRTWKRWMTQNTLFMIKNSLSVTQNTLFGNEITQNTLFYGLYVDDHNNCVSHLPGGHLPPPKFGHLPPPNSDISHPQKKKHLPGGQLPPPFVFFFWRTFLGFFDLQLMEDIKDGKEVLEEVVMEHIK